MRERFKKGPETSNEIEPDFINEGHKESSFSIFNEILMSLETIGNKSLISRSSLSKVNSGIFSSGNLIQQLQKPLDSC